MNEPVAQTQSGQSAIKDDIIMYYHNDHLGTPLFLTDEVGAIVWRREQKPFGETTLERGTVVEKLRFPGQYYDSETGLAQNWHRDYDAALGRYVEADPIGLNAGVNIYPYVVGNPTNYIDFRGLKKSKPECFKCDAVLPASPIKEVALTCFAEASNNCCDGTKEKRAITDSIYNRASKNDKSWCTEGGVLGVLACQYNGNTQYLGYGSAEYNRASNVDNLNNKTDCQKLKDCITAATASSSKTNYSYVNFNQTSRSGRTKICNHYFW